MKKSRLIRGNRGIQRNRLAIGIGDDNLLGTRREAGSHDRKRVDVFKGYGGGFSVERNGSGGLKTTALDGQRGAA